MQNDLEASPPDPLAVSRQSLVEAHIIHDFRLARVMDNLAGCYGILIKGVYREMLSLLKGSRIIDCGCGFGQFSRVAIDAGFEVASVDIDDASLVLARNISRIPCRKESVYATSLPDGSCDAAVCCDSIQHFDISRFIPELKRLGVRRIVIYDSNISNPLLASYRAMAGHKESNDRTADAIVREFREHGYDVTTLRYENVVSLPISGGFQRPPVPLLHRFPNAIQRVDRFLMQMARLMRLDRRLAFRFLIVLDRPEAQFGEAGT
jgi:SAM-dependent methyltransferase